MLRARVCVCMRVSVWISCQRPRPCGALLRPRATILLHYPPLAAQDLASSAALPGLRESTFVSQASNSVS